MLVPELDSLPPEDALDGSYAAKLDLVRSAVLGLDYLGLNALRSPLLFPKRLALLPREVHVLDFSRCAAHREILALCGAGPRDALDLPGSGRETGLVSSPGPLSVSVLDDLGGMAYRGPSRPGCLLAVCHLQLDSEVLRLLEALHAEESPACRLYPFYFALVCARFLERLSAAVVALDCGDCLERGLSVPDRGAGPEVALYHGRGLVSLLVALLVHHGAGRRL